ncbi:MAG: hypothetical protein AAFR45_09315, partial [Pseudomonadota bacterium]
AFDISNLKPPPDGASDFGEKLQSQFETRFSAAGLQIVHPDAVKQIAGQPHLKIFFSYAGHDDDDGCVYTFSVFATLTQTVLLTRNLQTKVSAGVWSYSTGTRAKDHSGNESDAILRVAERFLSDFAAINGS